uniref:Uncharacterized protein n=1 Tax=Lotharella oceanica TaxID=641309 RepID=A0A7S2XEZ4_9EUKA|mmetsp:Transcript_3588/g.6942  ORF Transcript_3588/g.6942 Transcript_3588/m.6942 type:complete len:110 (+) Transcript_3588:2372-2701(+)
MILEQHHAATKLKILLMIFVVIGISLIFYIIIVVIDTLDSSASASEVYDESSREFIVREHLLNWAAVFAFASYMYYAAPGAMLGQIGCCFGNAGNNDEAEAALRVETCA